jgi:phosphoglycolate phosphatase-like HAD superfamily hydrolase
VLSGNRRAVAARKLALADVVGLFTGHGAFGDEAEERADMLTVAVARDSRPGDRVCLVADSPRDATAGAMAGVPVVAVTTGGYSATQLRAATYVLDGLDDTALALAAVAGAAQRVPGMQGGVAVTSLEEASRRRRTDK